MIGYVAAHPTPVRANQFFEDSLQMVEAEVERTNETARAFNETLVPALTETLEEARERATERQNLAASLKPPKSYERWWGRP
jgi:hypothetical protein